jgi:CBS domain-containing membrane protein
LRSLVHEAQLLAYARTFRELTCEQIMSADVVSVSKEAPAATAWRLLERHRVKALPVIDDARHVVGIVTRTDFVGRTPFGRHRLQPIPLRSDREAGVATATKRPVAELMTADVYTVDASTPVAKLIPIFAHYGHHHIPVLDGQRRLVGMITQSDLIGGLHRHTQAQQVQLARA